MIKNNALDLKIRRKIYQYILKNQGKYFRQLCRELKIPKSTLEYHLSYMQKDELIKTESDGKYTFYFITNNLGNGEKIFLKLIRKETTRKIILYMIHMVSASQIELSKALEKHPTTIESHLKKLREMNIIEPARIENGMMYTKNNKLILRTPIGKEKIYILADPVKTYDLLVICKKKNFLKDQFTDDIIEMIEFFIRDEGYKKISTFEKYTDSLEEKLFDIFPHPYHA